MKDIEVERIDPQDPGTWPGAGEMTPSELEAGERGYVVYWASLTAEEREAHALLQAQRETRGVLQI